MKTPLLVTGLNGLVGSKFAQQYNHKYQFDSIDLRDADKPVDITQLDQVTAFINQSKAKVLIHLAAFTNVSAAWEQRNDKQGLAYQVNVNGTKNIIQACQQHDIHLIHISTAYVFNGEQTDKYTEENRPDPIEWYGQTKWEAEQKVMDSEIDWTILRIDQPFRSDPFEKADIAHRIIYQLKTNSLPPMFTNHYFGPTYLEDFSHVLDFIVRTGTTGLFHATNGEKWTDYQFAQQVKQSCQLPGEITAGDLDQYLQTTQRPYQRNTALDSSKLQNLLDFQLTPIKTAVKQLECDY